MKAEQFEEEVGGFAQTMDRYTFAEAYAKHVIETFEPEFYFKDQWTFIREKILIDLNL